MAQYEARVKTEVRVYTANNKDFGHIVDSVGIIECDPDNGYTAFEVYYSDWGYHDAELHAKVWDTHLIDGTPCTIYDYNNDTVAPWSVDNIEVVAHISTNLATIDVELMLNAKQAEGLPIFQRM